VLSLLGTVVSTVQFVSLMAFFAKVSDPAVGGSYMTTLNTATNLGTKWPSQLLLFSVTPLTTSLLDGYYVLVALTLLAGLAWIRVFYPVVLRLEAAGEKSWRL
jgi:PAT family acetyl-CoA transporter-like MFS transporter 1